MTGAISHRCLAAGAVAGLLLAGDARGETWVVDDDGPANFRDLPAAAAAAEDGDTLVLRPGRYQPVALQRKGLRIIGCGPGVVTIERTSGEGPFFEARELTARQSVVLSGVTGIGRGATIRIERCGGNVVLADLVIESRHPTRAGTGPMLSDCARAVIARVAVLPGEQTSAGGAFGLSLARGDYSLTQVVAVGPPGAPATSPYGRGGLGSVGLAVEDARVSIARCEFVGGVGGAALWDERAPFCPEAATAGPGGAGLFVAGATDLLAAGDGQGQVRGGDGGAASPNPWDRCWSFAGDGGAGVRVRADDATRSIAFSDLAAVAGSAGTGDPARAGKAGVEVDGVPEAVTTLDAPIPTLAIDHPGVCGGPISVRARGPPGAFVTILVSSDVGRMPVKSRKGFPLHVMPGNFWRVFRAGRIDADGELVLDAQLEADRDLVRRTFFVQAQVVASVQGRTESYLTNVDVLTIADGTGPAGPVAER